MNGRSLKVAYWRCRSDAAAAPLADQSPISESLNASVEQDDPAVLSFAARLFRRVAPLCLLVVLAWGGLASLSPSRAVAAEEFNARQANHWGRFSAGAWKRVRVTTETVDDQGRVVSNNVSETRTDITRVDDRGVTLNVQVMFEVAGKRLGSDKQTVRDGFYGEDPEAPLRVKTTGTSEVTIDGQKYLVGRREVGFAHGTQRTTSRVFFTSGASPMVLRRETKTEDDANPDYNHNVVTETVALDMPLQVLGEMRTVSFERTVGTTPSGSVITVDVLCRDIPGGVVSRTTKELDPKGQLVRRSTMELVDYGLGQDDEGVAAGRRHRRSR